MFSARLSVFLFCLCAISPTAAVPLQDILRHAARSPQPGGNSTAREDNIGRLYLSALRTRELIQAARVNLSRHNRLIADLSIIVRYDKTRQPELDQALAQRGGIQSYLSAQTQQLTANLNRLSQYLAAPITPADLQDPFARSSAQTLMQQNRADTPQTAAVRAAQAAMQQSSNNLTLAHRSIDGQKTLVRENELQFKIARRPLSDVLKAYIGLADAEQAAVGARGDFRDAALQYLRAQDAVKRWIQQPPAQ